MSKIELKGLRKLYYELYNIKHYKLVLIDKDYNIVEEISLPIDAFTNSEYGINKEENIQFDRLGVTLEKPLNKNKFIDKNTIKVYYRYDIDNEENIKTNIKIYQNKLKEWKSRSIVQKINDYINDILFEIKFENEVKIKPLEMYISQLNPISNCIHDETVSIIKIQSMQKNLKNNNLDIMKYLPYIGVGLLIIGALIVTSVFKIRLW